MAKQDQHLGDAPTLLHVMIVDDSELDLLQTKRALKKSPFVSEISEYSSPQHANAALIRNPALPDLLLLDVNMPGMNAFEFITRLQDLPAPARAVPIVLMLGALLPPKLQAIADEIPQIVAFAEKPLTAASFANMCLSLPNSPPQVTYDS